MSLPQELQNVTANQNYGAIPYDSDTTKGGMSSDGTYLFRVLDMVIVTSGGTERVFLNKQVIAVLEEGSKLQVGDVVKESASAAMGPYYWTRLMEMASVLHGFHGADEINANMTCADKDWHTPLKIQDNTIGRDSVFSQRIVTGPHMIKNNQTGQKEPKIDQDTGKEKRVTKRFYKGCFNKAEVLEKNPEAGKYFPDGFREDRHLFPHEPLVSSQTPEAPVDVAPAAPAEPAAPTTATAPSGPPE